MSSNPVNLADFPFTNGPDNFEVLTGEGVINESLVNTLNGNDIINAFANGISVDPNVKGLYNSVTGTIQMSNGDDEITGSAEVDAIVSAEAFAEAFDDIEDEVFDSDIAEVNAFGIYNSGMIETGNANDKVTGFAQVDVMASAEAFAEAIAFADEAIASAEASAEVEAIANASGIYNSGTIQMSNGDDEITGSAEVIAITNASSSASAIVNADAFGSASAEAFTFAIAEADAFGIYNSGTIQMSNGGDEITGSAKIEALATAEADAEAFADADAFGIAIADAEAIIDADTFGIYNSGTIEMDNGNDKITGFAEFENLFGHEDEDDAIGSASAIAIADSSADLFTEVFGIYNSGTIEMGNGDDEITGIGPDAFSGFLGGGMIDLGKGNDIIDGFGEQTVFGGKGFDTAKFDFELDMSITLDTSSPNNINITANEVITMSFLDVEQFEFANNETFTLEELQSMIT